MLGREPRHRADRRGPGGRGRTLVLARGFEYATAREWALKLKELAHVFADPYSAADFQHGPLALVEPGVPVLAIARRTDRAIFSPCSSGSGGTSVPR